MRTHTETPAVAVGRAAIAVLILLAAVEAAAADVAAHGTAGGGGTAPAGPDWVSWGQETYRLEPGETFQFTVSFEQIPARAWRLLIEADHVLSDVLIRRVADGSLLYAGRHESRHDVLVPWGRGEQISVALSAPARGSNRPGGGVYVVTFLGPPPDALPVSYSYGVNRALEAFAAGRREQARQLCEQAIATDRRDGAACVLLAGFLRDAGELARAGGMAEQALAIELSPEMRAVAAGLRDDVARRLGAGGGESSPLGACLSGLDARLAKGDAGGALATCDSLLREATLLSGPDRGRILLRRGEALQALDRRFEALDALTLALTENPAAPAQARVHLALGRLFVAMDNPAQAREAFKLARRQGLPPDLDVEAARALDELEPRKD